MSNNSKPLKTQTLHGFHLISRHHAFGVRQTFRVTWRFPAIAIPAKVWTDHRKAFGKDWRHAVPADVRLWVAMKEQNWTAMASLNEANQSRLCSDLLTSETIKQDNDNSPDQ
jgi:hypothetical protein